MGLGDKLNGKSAYQNMRSHPNYSDIYPLKGESKIEFATRWIANMVSPPQYDGETSEMECVGLAAAIKFSAKDIKKAWKKGQKRIEKARQGAGPNDD